MDAVSKTLPFGTVVRRGKDGMTVMVIGNVADFFKTDEIHVSPGDMVGFVLHRGTNESAEYWPLFGTCSITDIQREDSFEWEIIS